MTRKILAAMSTIGIAFVSVSGVSTFAGEPGTQASSMPNSSSAQIASDQTGKSVRHSEIRLQPEGDAEGVDCYYEYNRGHQDCGDSKTIRR